MVNKKFALIGTAGFVAPRHFRAIKETGNELVAAFDPHDAVGQLDSWFPRAASFTDFKQFGDFVEKQGPLDFLTVCSPNFLHAEQVAFGLKNGMNVICEKPLAIEPSELAPLEFLEKETGQRVWTILQLRLHPNLILLKKKVESAPKSQVFDIDLTYITPRGLWYFASWKADEQKSGGILTNIGIHLFDALTWIFGSCLESEIHQKTASRAAGFLKLERANVRWFLSIEQDILPGATRESAFRTMTVDGENIEFSTGFTDLHTESYRAILDGQGFSIKEASRAVLLTHQLRGQTVGFNKDRAHLLTFKNHH